MLGVTVKALLTPTPQPVRDLFATDFFATDWRSMRLVQPLYAHIRIKDYNRRLVVERFATGLRLVAVDTATCLQSGKNRSATSQRLVGDQSATGRLNLLTQMPKRTGCCIGVLTPTLQPVCNWFATRKKLKSQSGFKGRGEVFFKSSTSRRLKSVASCLLNMHKRLAVTEFDREGVA